MAHEAITRNISLVAAADLSAKQYHFVQVDTAGKAALSGATALTLGVLQNKPASGQVGTVCVDGVTKVVIAATLSAGSRVRSDANGQAVAASVAGNAVAGILLEGGVANDVVPMLIQRMPFAALA
jgi:hypothetical protein